MDSNHLAQLEIIKERRRRRGAPVATDTTSDSQWRQRKAEGAGTPYSSPPRDPAQAEVLRLMQQQRAMQEEILETSRTLLDTQKQRADQVGSPRRVLQNDATQTTPLAAVPDQVQSPARTGRRQSDVLGVYTKQNPYRVQTYFEYRVNPDQRSFSPTAKPSTKLRDLATQRLEKAAVPVERPSAMALYHLETSVQVLKAGDWFMKWIGRRTEVRRRHVWLCPKGVTLHWSAAENANPMFSGGLLLVDVTHIEGSILMWNERPDMTSLDIGKQPRNAVPVYVIRIWTRNYEMQLGTEKRDKYDLWFDALTRLTNTTRRYHAQHLSRVGQKPWEPDTPPPGAFVPNTDPSE